MLLRSRHRLPHLFPLYRQPLCRHSLTASLTAALFTVLLPQAGARVQQVVDALAPYGLTLENYASISEQQLGGFFQARASVLSHDWLAGLCFTGLQFAVLFCLALYCVKSYCSHVFVAERAPALKPSDLHVLTAINRSIRWNSSQIE